MKVTFYLDIFRGWKGNAAWATSNPPMELGKGFKRLSFVVDVPDSFLDPVVDLELPGVVLAKEVEP